MWMSAQYTPSYIFSILDSMMRKSTAALGAQRDLPLAGSRFADRSWERHLEELAQPKRSFPKRTASRARYAPKWNDG